VSEALSCAEAPLRLKIDAYINSRGVVAADAQAFAVRNPQKYSLLL
jgi:hypothetical protein